MYPSGFKPTITCSNYVREHADNILNKTIWKYSKKKKNKDETLRWNLRWEEKSVRPNKDTPQVEFWDSVVSKEILGRDLKVTLTQFPRLQGPVEISSWV